MASKFTQEMPPSGGYGPIEWAKKPAVRGVPGWAWFAGWVGLTSLGVALYARRSKQYRYMNLENNDARCALEPLMIAEQQRLFLRQLRKNLEEEKILMKDVPGWVPGTLWGEPVYHNRYDRWIQPAAMEFYAHVDPYEYYLRATEHVWH